MDWDDAITAAGADPGGARGLHRALEARWAEPQRAYHGRAHLAHVLAVVGELRDAGEPVADPAAVVLAAWYHDAIYDPWAGDNEARSADLARRDLAGLGVDPARVARVADLVLATRDHRPADPDAAVLVDADLAILAAAPDAYAAYAAAVRTEYAFVPEDAWRAGRAAVLQGFLARPRLYTTPTQHARADARARANLGREVAALTRAGS